MIRRFLMIGAAVAALGLAACGQKPDESKSAARPVERAATPEVKAATTVSTPAKETRTHIFASRMAGSVMFESQAAKLAAARSTNPSVKTFAKTMGAACKKTSRSLNTAIVTSGVTINRPTMLSKAMQNHLDDLAGTDAKDFDRAYAKAMVDAQQASLNVLQRYAQDGDTAALKAFAAETAPQVQAHLTMAEGLKKGFDTGEDVAKARQ